MESRLDGEKVVVRLFKGDKLFESLKEAAERHGLQNAFVVSGVGMLHGFELGFFVSKGKYDFKRFAEPHELLSLDGNVCAQPDGEIIVHLHGVLGDGGHNAIGGHLQGGTISVAAEILLVKTGAKIVRKLEEETGLKGMYFG